jgi:tetratricopeptide (TPR) repeat protein
MDFANKVVSFYGRFSRGARAPLIAAVKSRGAIVDKGANAPVVVVGARALSCASCKAIAGFAQARATILSEGRLHEILAGVPQNTEPANVPVEITVKGAFSLAEAEVLAAFDLVRIEDGRCRFSDAATLRAAAELARGGNSMHEIALILRAVRTMRPLGPNRIVVGPGGKPALRWAGGQVTTVAGQGYLELDAEAATPDELFAAAREAEAAGDTDVAVRLYEICARADPKDPAALFNLGNVLLMAGAADRAKLAFQQAIARKGDFAEAHYNLAVALERLGRTAGAKAALAGALKADPNFADAQFNLAQLEMKDGALDKARGLYETYLRVAPPGASADTARKALIYCSAKRSA